MSPRHDWTRAVGKLTALCALSLACTEAPTGGDPAVASSFAGVWQYTASSPVAARSISGTLTITAADGTIGGTLDVLEATTTGNVRVAGPITGRVVDESTLDFSVQFAPNTRQHIASRRGDSLSGTWLELSGSSVLASGAFRAVRTR